MHTEVAATPAYLAATKLCDCNSPWVRARAAEIVNGARSPAAKALEIFYYVRDNIRFSLAYSRSKSSQILKRGYGECGTKTNAQVALLRAVSIPARYRWVRARTAVLHHLIDDFVYRHLPPIVSHFWCECHLNGRWVSCEALLDKRLYQGMLERRLIAKHQVPTIDWDGETDLVLLTPWITSDHGHLASYDDAIAALQHSDEGMPPPWMEWVIAPVSYRLNLRNPDTIRGLAAS
jgi:transglutaminase-like putative cysteine protease